MITFDEFKKVEMKVGQILKAEPVEGSDKLLQLEVDFGEDKTRTVVSGIAGHVDLESFVGSKKVFITNLEPRSIMGIESGHAPACGEKLHFSKRSNGGFVAGVEYAQHVS